MAIKFGVNECYYSNFVLKLDHALYRIRSKYMFYIQEIILVRWEACTAQSGTLDTLVTYQYLF